jgi:hypothetical protein
VDRDPTDLGGCCSCFDIEDVCDYDPVTVGGEPVGDRAADPSGSARD